MPKIISLVLTPKQASDATIYVPLAAQRAGVSDKNIALARVVKRSIDARSKNIKVNLSVELYIDEDVMPDAVHFDYPDVSNKTEVIVIGSGPAGLFAALRLIEKGYKPIVLERGNEVSARKRDIAQINRNAEINPNSNYAFGEGGAGTFSDGKLFTRSKKRGDYNRALRVFHFHGADESILYDAHPHIGTDKLPTIIKNMRESIISSGGKVIFNAKVSEFIIKQGKITGVKCGDDIYQGAAVVLATGHSAKDIYRSLHSSGVRLEAKNFAMGVRVEHPQALIDRAQYKMSSRGDYLPAASYSLVSQVGGRGVYSFCMCPGGFIVPAMTDSSESVVNGMSPSLRNSYFANSGIVTEIRESDYAHLIEEFGVLAGLEYQQMYEKAAKLAGGDAQIAPAQRLDDFVSNRPSRSLPKSSYVPGVVSSKFSDWMPKIINDSLVEGFKLFDRKVRGFVCSDAQILGVESRTSSPIRVPRDRDSFMHPEIQGLFPCGEGAGYAGGIISAALDGERVAEAVALYL
ncbi:MAG: FAD-binding protein [Rikenellaceae bacterium]